jgi:LysM repeat protein
VVRGDTLFNIARRASSSVDALTAANCLNDPTQISRGQTIYVPNEIAAGEEPRSSNELVQIFLIIPEDNGASGLKVGCNDSAIAVWQDQEKTGNTATDLKASMEALFAIRTATYGQSGLVHSLDTTDVEVDNVTVEGDFATIEMSGDFLLIGTCGDARMQAQIFLTIFQYQDINRAFVTMNGVNLKQWFDMSGLTDDTDPYLRGNFGYLE